ncbi:MAG: hypothetical protein OEY03_09095, partial [Rhizobacter sp.]|nr:hypothetical protein [Rhizobacter sp.]
MNLLTPFILLIERRGWRGVLAWALLATTLLASLFGASGTRAQLATSSPDSSTKTVADTTTYSCPATTLTTATTAWGKVATDLKLVIAAPVTPVLNWVKDLNGVRYVKVLLIGDTSDPDMAALRSCVLSMSGSVYFSYTSVRALSVLL